MTNQPTCKERINDRFTSKMERLNTCLEYNDSCDLNTRIDEIKDELEYYDFSSVEGFDWRIETAEIIDLKTELSNLENRLYDGETREGFNEGILSADIEISVRVCLSTGGPADGFVLSVSDNGYGELEIDSAEYYFQDWYDGATMPVTDSDLDAVKDMLNPEIANLQVQQ